MTVLTRQLATAAWVPGCQSHLGLGYHLGLRAGCWEALSLVAWASCAEGQRAGPGGALVLMSYWKLGNLKPGDQQDWAVVTQHGNLAGRDHTQALPQIQTAASPANMSCHAFTSLLTLRLVNIGNNILKMTHP